MTAEAIGDHLAAALVDNIQGATERAVAVALKPMAADVQRLRKEHGTSNQQNERLLRRCRCDELPEQEALVVNLRQQVSDLQLDLAGVRAG